MDIGQMFSPLAAMTQASGAESMFASAVSGLPANSTFAGLLQETASSQSTAEAAKTGSEMQVVVNEEILKTIEPEILVSQLTPGTPGTSVKVAASGKREELPEESSQTKGLMPQDVALLLAGTMNIQPLQNGRTPESQNNDSQATEEQPTVVGRIDLPPVVTDNLGSKMVRGKEVATEEVSAAGVKTALSLASNVSSGMTGKLNNAGSISAAVLEVAKAAEEMKGNQSSLTGSKLVASESGSGQGNVPPVTMRQGNESNRPGSRDFTTAVQRSGLAGVSVAKDITEKQPILKASGPSQGLPVNNAPIATAPITTQTTTLPLPETALLDLEVAAITAPLSDQAAPQAGIRLVHSSAVTHPQAAVVMDQVSKKADGREEVTIKQQLDLNNQKSLEGAAFGLQKVTASAGAENEVMGDAEHGTGEQGSSDQFALSSPLQHAKTEAKHFETASVKEPTRSDLPENVVRQVKDLFVTREIKSGNEQMTLKLSPEHLGELTLSFKMENQQLKVQIIAENQSVKDALMQHSESLKESLFRQNIKMESFEVLTNSGQRGFEQNDRGWKQLAQQQFTPRAQAYGSRYAISEVNADALPQYGRSQQYAMVDVHF